MSSVAEAPKIGIVTPCHNAQAFLPDLARSILQQTLEDWRHVIVNDGSTDGSAGVLHDLARRDPRFRVIQQGQSGVCAARNRGAEEVQGCRYLLFLDADDYLQPTMLARLTEYLDDHPSVAVVYCGLSFVDQHGKETAFRDWNDRLVPWGLWSRKVPDEEPGTPFVSLYCQAGGLPTRAIVRASAYTQSGGWNEGFGQHYEDTEMFLRLALLGEVHYLDAKLAVNRRHPAQSTANLSTKLGQEAKLYSLWLARAARDESIRDLVWGAERFRTGRFRCRLGATSGFHYLRRGTLGLATRFLAGAARAYLREALAWVRKQPPPFPLTPSRD